MTFPSVDNAFLLNPGPTQTSVDVQMDLPRNVGVGVADVLPGIDLDLMAGGMFRDSEQLGDFTTTSIEGYWIGLGMTWRFGRGACECLPAPDSWCSGS